MQGVLVILVVIGLPIAGGLALAAYQRWLKHKERVPIPPERLRQIEKELLALHQENQQLRRRVQNLETIVASVDWERILEKRSFASDEPATSPQIQKQILGD